VDGSSNESACSLPFAYTEDSTAPQTTIDAGPSGPTDDPTPSFAFSSDEPGSSFECRFDADPFAPCSGPGETHTPPDPLPDGPHTFEVRAIDAAGNPDPLPASRAFDVDTTPDVQPPGTPPPDSNAPDLGLSTAGWRRAGGAIKLEVGCAEDCLIAARGKIVARGAKAGAAVRAARATRIKLREAEAEIAAGETATLKLRPKGRRASRTLRRLVASGASAKAKIKLTAVDPAGNSTVKRVTVRLRS
jgi:hypothetical protein